MLPLSQHALLAPHPNIPVSGPVPIHLLVYATPSHYSNVPGASCLECVEYIMNALLPVARHGTYNAVVVAVLLLLFLPYTFTNRNLVVSSTALFIDVLLPIESVPAQVILSE